MDFNTGGRREDDRPLYGSESRGGSAGGPSRGPAGGPPRGPVGGGGEEFNLQDPVGSFISTVQSVILSPVNFFRGIARRGDFLNPVIFALICYEIFAVLGGVIGLVFGSIGSLGPGDAGEQAAGVAISFGSFIVGIIVAPIIAAVILFVTAGIRHLLVILIVGSENAGFEATLRAQSYTFATRLVWWIPILGTIVGFLYGLFLCVVGIREVHTTTTGKAALVVLLPVAVVVLLVLLLVLLLGAFIFTLLQQQQF